MFLQNFKFQVEFVGEFQAKLRPMLNQLFPRRFQQESRLGTHFEPTRTNNLSAVPSTLHMKGNINYLTETQHND